jgi:hypothetical protein
MVNQIGNDAMGSVDWHGGTPQDCQSVSAPTITPFDVAGAPRPGLPFFVALASSTTPLPRYVDAVVHTPSTVPLSGAPAYLRHQRLLI